MVGSQPNHHPTILHFTDWSRETSRKNRGTGGLTHEVDHPFIPVSDLQSYFATGNTLVNILQAIFGIEGDVFSLSQSIRHSCLKAFSILLSIGQGHFIRQFSRFQSLCDEKLPFESKPFRFPDDPSDEGFFAKFCAKQWIFCAPELKYDMDTHFVDQLILPIIEKRPLSEGGNAETYIIEVHDAYNGLHPSGNKTKTFVLKTYRGIGAEDYYNSEISAFRQLLTPNTELESCIIGFYGSYRHNETFNLILEYADKGSLEDYMRTEAPPTDGEEINQLWRGLLDISKALVSIHTVEQNSSDKVQYWQGWHQDVKPKNILVASCGEASPYKYNFKLADLGTSHFKRIRQNQTNVLDRDTYGGRAYGAPESYRAEKYLAGLPIKVEPVVDIWSLGCVFSEVAVWTTCGLLGLQQYRKEREHETDRINGFRGGNCFHDGNAVLQCVNQTHQNIIQKKLRRSDYFTEKLLENLVNWTLKVSEARLNARQLRYAIQGILGEAEQKVHKKLYGYQPREVAYRSLTTPQTPFAMPPVLPSSHQRPDMQNDDSTGRPMSEPPGNLAVRRNVLGMLDRGVLGDEQDSEDEGNVLVASPKSLTHQTSYHLNRNESVMPSKASRRGTFRERPRSGAKELGHIDHTSSQESRRDEISIELKTASLPAPSNRHYTPSLAYTQAPPYLSVADAFHWKEQKKSSSAGRTTLPNSNLLDEIIQRDHVFLVDDSSPMQRYWEEATRLLGLLAYMAKDADPDGIDLYFTISTSPHKSRHSQPLMKAMQDRVPVGQTDIKLRLGSILQDYQQRLQDQRTSSSISRRGPLSFIPLSKKAVRKMNVYILTTGDWQPLSSEAAEAHIRSLVEKLQALSYPSDQVGLQFISFGDSTQGLSTLQRLDQLDGIAMDIVDTEGSNGNVWKMLVGATNKWFDGDRGPGSSQG